MAARTLHVLMIVEARLVAGLARGLVLLAEHLPRNVEVHVAVVPGAGVAAATDLEPGVSGRPAWHPLPGSPVLDPRQAPRLLALAHRLDIGLVESHGTTAHLLGAMLRALRGLPWIANQPGPGADSGFVARRLDARCLPHADLVLAGSAEARLGLLQAGSDPARVLEDLVAIDPAELSGGYGRAQARRAYSLPPEALLASCVGPLVRERGQDVLLRALGRLRARGVAVGLLLHGEGPERPALHRLAATQGVRTMVRFLGAQPAAPTAYRAGDFAVLPLRTAVAPRELVEPALLGVPLVAARVEGVTELAIDGAGAWIVPPDDPEALAEAMVDVATHPAERERRAQRLRAAALARHDPGRQALRRARVYETLLGCRLVSPGLQVVRPGGDAVQANGSDGRSRVE